MRIALKRVGESKEGYPRYREWPKPNVFGDNTILEFKFAPDAEYLFMRLQGTYVDELPNYGIPTPETVALEMDEEKKRKATGGNKHTNGIGLVGKEEGGSEE